MTTKSSRSILIALGLGFSLASACLDESVLENEECGEKADCASDQVCVQTAYQAESTNVSSFGWCRPEPSCAVGMQPGCQCLQVGEVYSCEKHESAEFAVCPSSQDADCLCVFPSTVDPTRTDNTSCPTS